MTEEGGHILSIEGLDVFYGDVPALHGVTLSVAPGEIMGLVGESGSGKSTVLRATAGLLGQSGRVCGGSIRYRGRDVTALSRVEVAALRGSEIAYVFQDPVASLDPLARIGSQFDECIQTHGATRGAEARTFECALLDDMGLKDPERVLRAYPHELSGGMCQRVVLAMSVACNPSLLLADEPTSALDATSQLQVLKLLLRIRAQRECSMLVVSHNIAAIAQVADRIGVMKHGEIVEIGTCDQIVHEPVHPYTRALIAAVPRTDGTLPCVMTSGEYETGGNDVA